ncbi:hypothetical protein EDD22DRAFT_846892 [Suillus occidentalis]|nr:hypothetical protein EDD22DRAFT_846892 [Suillus occidentalis]
MPASSIEQQALFAQLKQQGFHIQSFRQRILGIHPAVETILMWLRSTSSDPDWSQRLFESETASPPLGLTGGPIKDLYPTLSPRAKEQLVRSYADFALKLFDIVIPQTIGTISVMNPSDELTVIPRICSVTHAHASEVFPTLQNYLEYLSTWKKRRAFTLDTGDENRFRAQASISQLIAHLRKHLTQLDERCVCRMVLAHDGLGDMNFMVDSSGNITSILDWWRNSTLPAILAADYPPWLR